MTLSQLYRILASRRRVAIAFWALCILGSLVAVTLIPERYSSTAQIFVNLTDANNSANVQVPAAVVRNYISTQVETLRSRATALAVIETEKLDQDPQWQAAFARAGAQGDLRDFISAALLSNVTVARLAASDLIAITFSHSKAEGAQHFANAFANAYVRRHVELNAETSQEQATWLDGRLTALRERLVQTETARSTLRREAVERGDTSAAGIVEGQSSLTAQIAEARKTIVDTRAALAQIQSTRAVVDTPEVGILRRQLAELDVGIARELPLLGNEHRRVISLRANRDQLQFELNQAIDRIRGDQLAVKQREVAAAEQRLVDLTAELMRQEGTRDRETASRAAGASYDREIETLRAQIEALVQRREKATTAATASTSNVMVLTPANLPTAPSAPKVGLIIGLATAFGAVFGIALAFLAEMLDRRVRCPEDIESYSPAPILGNIPRTRISGALVPSTARLAAKAATRRNRGFANRPDMPRITILNASS
jgi:succinoglycan biosynthesis transport protein ExoP